MELLLSSSATYEVSERKLKCHFEYLTLISMFKTVLGNLISDLSEFDISALLTL